MSEEKLVTEVPSSLKELARLVVRGFYSIEDSLIIDMLIRNPCMKEDDICELLKFERKMLRARITTLKSDKFIQVRLRMETGADGKAQKVNYYFINYKTFVNVVKYKLDLMRKRMETEERDATSRASFKCPQCSKTFTDLEADQLFDFATEEFRCTHCREVVEEDQSAIPKKDSRLLLAKFNSQLEPLYILLRQVEGIRLAPEVLEPEPVDINVIRGLDMKRHVGLRPPGEHWSGEATRGQGFAVQETKVDVTIGESDRGMEEVSRKERPVWMIESTVVSSNIQNDTIIGVNDEAEKTTAGSGKINNNTTGEDIMSVLLAHERRGGSTPAVGAAVKAVLPPDSASESSDEDDGIKDIRIPSPGELNLGLFGSGFGEHVDTLDSDEDDLVPLVTIGDRTVAVTEVNDELIKEMSPNEKEAYIQIYQEYYSHILE
uniref:General transcription factor IIE subunit 1 n=1 Tax=Clastoptera arizonana TaxID=38151 RepID=A0A1B6E3X9_9HEMI